MSAGLRTAWLAVGAAAALVGTALAASGASVLVLGITEGPDPVPQVLWVPAGALGQVDPAVDDGCPDLAFLGPQLTVVWSTLDGLDYDIALARWNGKAWDPEQALATGGGNERDPRAFVDAGGTRVTWWVAEDESVRLVRSQGLGFGAPEFVTAPGVTGRRPSVAVWAADELVSWERAAGVGQQIVLARREPGGTFAAQVLFDVARTKPLDAKLHVEQGRLWIDWKQSDTQFAYSERKGSQWTAPLAVPWNDPSWAGEERTRAFIRGLVLAP